MAGLSFLNLQRLRVMWRGHAVYDEKFHAGVNIIRGENGSGKSTIADFIFYILGGEFEDWKEQAGQCEEVQAELLTPRGKLTFKRAIGQKLTPIQVFFGSIDEAQKKTLDGWESFPIRRQGSKESISQVLFRSMEIPEAQSEGASNITMHQLMRLLYSDQRTPSTRLFRFESFDTQNIREAVGDLVCGISGYELYEINLKLRDLEKEFEEASRKLSALLRALPHDEKLNNPEVINSRVRELENERDVITKNIENVDTHTEQSENSEFIKERNLANSRLKKIKRRISDIETIIGTNELELSELTAFLEFLSSMAEKVKLAEKTSKAIGAIEFTQCPACLSDLKEVTKEHICNVCGNETDPDADKARYNQIRLDLEIQIRESQQLADEKNIALKNAKIDYRVKQKEYAHELSEYTVKYDLSSSPREAYLASQNQRIGQIEREIEQYLNSLELAEEIQELSAQKGTLSEKIQSLKDRRAALTLVANRRRTVALTSISDIASSLLRQDLNRQAEFSNAQSVTLNFRDDAIFVEGKMNFAESSNVFLKNSAIFGMFLAAGQDSKFYHPRFLVLDNIEDKGMEVKRSHLFQRLIVEKATLLKVPFQIIYTTSMMNPELELEDYVIGPHYSHENRTLNFPHQ